eukprot:CAMPEP_0196745950 /NCGR_PEP_ID=MMETSP1091-20130531/63783_1 /TAXON_ID=302021 /ORGANISM="Rhodomonas sp., Strain CCMP768" /LENGTH=281 /DNA_ID=CAMNT_0042092817 /DNA_START=165 /DNA_END=1010 /DNA_ORIENTATION=+
MKALKEQNHKVDSDIHFVTFRNNLNKIMETPYNNKNAWKIRLERDNGTIFMHVVQLEESFSGRDQKKFQYWGYKFEEVCCRAPSSADASSTASAQVQPDETVNANVEFCSVFRMSFGSSRCIVAAEMDCAEPTQGCGREGEEDGARTGDNLGNRKQRGEVGEEEVKFVEIKTSREMTAPHHQRTFQRFKLLKFWIQSFIGGVPSICCGFRDDNGILNDFVMYKTLEIPRLVRGKPNMWDPRRCIDFTAWVLAEVRRATVDGGRYELQYEHPFSHVRLVKVN